MEETQGETVSLQHLCSSPAVAAVVLAVLGVLAGVRREAARTAAR